MEGNVGDIVGRIKEPRGLGPGPDEAWLCCVPAVNKAFPCKPLSFLTWTIELPSTRETVLYMGVRLRPP